MIRNFIDSYPKISFVVISFLVFIIVYILLDCFPKNQVTKKQGKLFSAIEKNDWEIVEKLVSLDYTDRWLEQREHSIGLLKGLRSNIILLNIQYPDPIINRRGKHSNYTVNLKISAIGAAGPRVEQKINSLQEPFVFTWQKESFWPTSWRLMRCDQPRLTLPPNVKSYLDEIDALREQERKNSQKDPLK